MADRSGGYAGTPYRRFMFDERIFLVKLGRRPSGIAAQTTYVRLMSETRQILILTYVVVGIMVLEFLSEPSVALRGLTHAALLAPIGLVLLRIRARRRSSQR